MPAVFFVVAREPFVWILSGAFPIGSGKGSFLVTCLATHASGLLDKPADMPTAKSTGLSLELFAGATTFFVIGRVPVAGGAGDDYRLAALASVMAPRNSTIVWAPR